jgi:hypothetical protein
VVEIAGCLVSLSVVLQYVEYRLETSFCELDEYRSFLESTGGIFLGRLDMMSPDSPLLSLCLSSLSGCAPLSPAGTSMPPGDREASANSEAPQDGVYTVMRPVWRVFVSAR